jgi:hypothetical protein
MHISALHGTAMNLATEMGSMANAVTELRELAGKPLLRRVGAGGWVGGGDRARCFSG